MITLSLWAFLLSLAAAFAIGGAAALAFHRGSV